MISVFDYDDEPDYNNEDVRAELAAIERENADATCEYCDEHELCYYCWNGYYIEHCDHCSGITESKGCSRCYGLIRCEDCTDCHNLGDCIFCNDSFNMKRCRKCSNCSDCSDSIALKFCVKATNCLECVNCEGIHHCENCHDLRFCRDCYYSSNLFKANNMLANIPLSEYTIVHRGKKIMVRELEWSFPEQFRELTKNITKKGNVFTSILGGKPVVFKHYTFETRSVKDYEFVKPPKWADLYCSNNNEPKDIERVAVASFKNNKAWKYIVFWLGIDEKTNTMRTDRTEILSSELPIRKNGEIYMHRLIFTDTYLATATINIKLKKQVLEDFLK